MTTTPRPRARRPSHEPRTAPAPRVPRGIQSVEVGGQLLIALSHAGGPLALKDLAREAGMAPAKAHPYLVSFGKLGLIEQEGASGRYGLGPLALQLGLLSLQQNDPVRLASERLEALAQAVQHTVAISVWGTHGSTVVRIQESPAAVRVTMRHGTVASLRGTATGMLFAAYQPTAEVLRLLREQGDARPGAQLPRAFEAQLQHIRAQGFCVLPDGVVPGVSAAAAPVFDVEGRPVLALTAIGPNASFDLRPEGPVVRVLVREAQAVSRRLGWRAG